MATHAGIARLRYRVAHALVRLRNRHYLVIDAVAVAISPSLALYLRIDKSGWDTNFAQCLAAYTVLSVAVRLPIFRWFGLYCRLWRYATVDDLMHIVMAVVVSTAALWVALGVGTAFGVWERPLPRSVPIIGAMIVFVMVGGTRAAARMAQRVLRGTPLRDARRVLIVGAGRHGQAVARELITNPAMGMVPVAFVDDDRQKQGMRIQGVPVVGGHESLREHLISRDVDQVVIAMPDAPGRIVRKCVDQCEEVDVPTKTVPDMSGILGGRFRVSQLRDVQIEDLLRRDAVQIDTAAVAAFIRGKRVLVTGGGGSIGSELCRQVLDCYPSELTVLGHGENSVFEVENELIGRLSNMATARGGADEFATRPVVRSVVADVRMKNRIGQVMRDRRPQIVFHAAAHKHVPLMEANPTEAVHNNVLGTRNLLDAAHEVGVEHLVMISTDKAVKPTSVMGASKRAAELLVLDAARSVDGAFVAVRFGNVLGSRGSVVPTFKRQIAAGGPVTVSHAEMRRYFMTIPEAVQLVLQAATLGKGGEVFTLDMGEPIRIVDLARDLIELSGLRPGDDIEIVFTGMRPGEKLYEELFNDGETYERTHHTKVLRARNASSFVPSNLHSEVREMERAVASDDPAKAVECLRRLIPEYGPNGEAAVPEALEPAAVPAGAGGELAARSHEAA